jgi:hypothetical protein
MSYSHALADRYNAARVRRDVEWAVDQAGGLYLRDAVGWSEMRTEKNNAQRERERRVWARNHEGMAP